MFALTPTPHLSLSFRKTLIKLLCLLKMAEFSSSVTQDSNQPEVHCHDWGIWNKGSVRVYDSEAVPLHCPLFSHPTLYSYTQTHNSSLSLLWYRRNHTHELEQPINLRLHTMHKEREYLWIQPVSMQDAGLYICMLQNISNCVKIGVELEVVHRDGACDPTAQADLNLTIPIQSDRMLSCPQLNTLPLPNSTHSVSWFHLCRYNVFRGDREVIGDNLRIFRMSEAYSGLYTCVVSYQMNGRALNFSRSINVIPVVPDVGSKVPMILNPAIDQIYDVILDNKTVEQLADRRFSSPEPTEFNCSARNSRGFNTSRAILKSRPYVPKVELGCGLGVTLALMLMMFVVYHVFWLELLLLYRSWFGSDESEEEEFVLSTLRRVLENEFGYSVCIFDRDSLPGGTVTDDTLRCVSLSRRLLVVLSSSSAISGSQALLELQAGLVLHGFSLRVLLVQFRPLHRKHWVRELRQARLALTLVRWEGCKSAPLTSRFWKRLQLELPKRKSQTQTHTQDVLPDVTKQTDSSNGKQNLLESVLRCMQLSRRLLVVLSSDCLCEKSLSLLEVRLCLYLHHTSHARIITVRRCTLSKATCSEITELRNNSTYIRWHDARAPRKNSRFWKQLHLSMPVRPLSLGKRLIDSSSSHSDLASIATRFTHAQTVSLNRRSKGIQIDSQLGMRQLGVYARNGHGCEQMGRVCAICVSFQESRRIWNGVLAPQWDTHLHQTVANGTIAHHIETGNELCHCGPNQNNIQTTHC
ncbi:hypothetical protein DNTS_027967 [Danionella cerebrum]|uniref:Interleukin-1 receptor accessory protein n=1 Tax=Danionella cerebrum TaxID=2873325 RepID=A0A553Q155_9TELE|nr:hypothetical protein DNTS_027967 [Danionella translucida]